MPVEESSLVQSQPKNEYKLPVDDEEEKESQWVIDIPGDDFNPPIRMTSKQYDEFVKKNKEEYIVEQRLLTQKRAEEQLEEAREAKVREELEEEEKYQVS